jgi:hypothetical protein
MLIAGMESVGVESVRVESVGVESVRVESVGVITTSLGLGVSVAGGVPPE